MVSVLFSSGGSKRLPWVDTKLVAGAYGRLKSRCGMDLQAFGGAMAAGGRSGDCVRWEA
jgi:hypothetical protein